MHAADKSNDVITKINRLILSTQQYSHQRITWISLDEENDNVIVESKVKYFNYFLLFSPH